MGVIKLLLEEVLKRPHGLLAVAVFGWVFVLTWLYYDFAPSQTPLTTRELWGAALIEFPIIAGGIWIWFKVIRRNGKPEDGEQDGET